MIFLIIIILLLFAGNYNNTGVAYTLSLFLDIRLTVDQWREFALFDKDFNNMLTNYIDKVNI